MKDHIANTQIQEYVQRARGAEKDKANAILASMRSGSGLEQKWLQSIANDTKKIVLPL